MHQVSEEFIRSAHNAACSEWREKIERQFPELYPPPFAKIGSIVLIGHDRYVITWSNRINEVLLVSTETGNHWTVVHLVSNSHKITKDEMDRISEGYEYTIEKQ